MLRNSLSCLLIRAIFVPPTDNLVGLALEFKGVASTSVPELLAASSCFKAMLSSCGIADDLEITSELVIHEI